MTLRQDPGHCRRKTFLKWTILFCLCAMLTFGCSSSDNDDISKTPPPEEDTQGVRFAGVDVPTTDAAKRSVQASAAVTIDGKSHDIGFHTLMRSGQVFGAETFGLVHDQNGNPVIEVDGSQFISSDNDFSSLIPKGDRLFNITHFESRPGAMYLSELRQDAATGQLTAVSTRSLDFSAWGGLWVPCAGSVTPWNSHLGSEEYPPDARAVEAAETPDDIDDYYKPMLRYFGITDPFSADVTIEQIQKAFHPYRYGYPVEVALDEEGGDTVSKRYAMGRIALELAYVMPDRKTVYLSDDGTNVGFFMFIADAPGDLTAGTLYAARWIQVTEENGGSADIEWISLGHAVQAGIKGMIDGGIRFSDIFETASPGTDGACPSGFTSINTEAGQECLKVKPGMEIIASRLETRRYAAMKGASTEFRKEEGITFDTVNKKLYVAMSEVSQGMEDFKKNGKVNDGYDRGGPNDIRLPYNACGCVYGLDVGPDAAVGSDYVVKNMKGVVSGTMKTYDKNSPYANNTCDVDGIANPDNLTFITGKDILIIGEDTGSGHQNDAVWAYDIKKGELTRIETTPYGSETTSPYYYPNINGWAYLMSVIQHPYGESDTDKLTDASEAAAYVGFIGPIPAMDEAVAPAAAVVPPLQFENIPVPVTDAEKRQVNASAHVVIDGKRSDIGFNTLMRSGDTIGGQMFGLIYDKDGHAVKGSDGSIFVSSDNDFSSLLPAGGRLFNVTHFESRPGAMYLTELAQDPATGTLKPVRTQNIDFSAWGGLWVPCAGSVTPWNTHLGSEEYQPNARSVEEAETPDDIDDYFKAMLRYFGIVDPFADTVTLDDIRNNFNPYLYGYPVEVTVSPEGVPSVKKHYAMGRVAVELAYVMPDDKTVYISDDGTNVGLFMFIADTPKDLSAGTLYAAKWRQKNDLNGGRADLEWISLGHAAQNDIKAAIDAKTVFSDLFETADANEDGSCPVGFTSVNTTDGLECLRVKEGMDILASRLETRRYAALMGATTEFRKEEGITFDRDNNVLYVAMSELNQGMEDFKKNGKPKDSYDKGGAKDIRLPYNDCGCVYGLDVGADSGIGSDYVARNMYGVVSGKMTTYPDDSPFANNTCDVDRIANPDNLTFITGKETLIIGEDTGSGHQNDAVWAYNIKRGDLTRIETTPYGSETTSPYYYPNINGWAYIMGVIQHPFGESDADKLTDASEAAAYVGFIGPMPAMDR
ncbi:PhoX family phosphatase [Desulfococcus sp.]|uniref:PhoX family protein n=1 Tax=Desulfococcus sp. TaxID=2025834 RepID=UPI0035934365